MGRDERLRYEAQWLRRGSALLHRLIEHEDRADVEALPDLKRSFDAVARTAETDVHQDGIGLLPLGEANGIFSAACHAVRTRP